MKPVPTVFVVDDDEAVLEALSLFFSSVGWGVKTFRSAQAFLDGYNDGETPSCLILDVRMPGMNGTELQKELEQRESEVPILFISGHGEVPIASHALKAGAVDFIEKPFDGEELILRIKEVLDPAPPGLLTRVTQRLSPEESLELYQEILPMLVVGILNCLDHKSSIREVQAISDHFCTPEVRDRLQRGSHVRDVIADEMTLVLGKAGLRPKLTREKLMAVIEESRTKHILVALEACLLRSRVA